MCSTRHAAPPGCSANALLWQPLFRSTPRATAALCTNGGRPIDARSIWAARQALNGGSAIGEPEGIGGTQPAAESDDGRAGS